MTNQYAITLKNLYRLLTVNDYLLFSNGVLPVKYRSGLTLTSFWRDTLLPAWQNGIYGREIWRRDRSRYLSDFCNRRDTVPFYAEYAEEIRALLDQERFCEQMDLLVAFFLAHGYDPDLFQRKAEWLIQASQEDKYLTKQDCVSLLKVYSGSRKANLPEEFCDAWVFTVLMLCAMCGKAENVSLLLRMLWQKELTPKALYRFKNEAPAKAFPRRLAADAYGAAENPIFFFGRQQELFDLTEAVRGRGKIFISGIGGVGKTELLRQLLSHLSESEQYTQLIPVCYEETLPKSLLHLSPELSGHADQEGFAACLKRLEALPAEKTVLLIDNAEVKPEENKYWKALARLACAVIVSSREKAPEGFAELSLDGLSEEASLLMLRRHTDDRLREMQQDLTEMIRHQPLMRHPLTIRLAAAAAKRNGWTGRQIAQKLWSPEEPLIRLLPRLRLIYRSLYEEAALNGEELRLVQLLSCLPYEQYAAGQLRQFCLKEISPEETESLLNGLYQRGWIEKKGSSYSLHPLLAECVAEDGFSEEALACFWAYARENLGSYVLDYTLYEEKQKICRYVLSAAKHLKGAVSADNLRMISAAALTEQDLDIMSARYRLISRLLAAAGEKSAEQVFLTRLTEAAFLKTAEAGPLYESFLNCLDEAAADPGAALADASLLFHYFLYRSDEWEYVRLTLEKCEELITDPETLLRLHLLVYFQAERSYHRQEASALFEKLQEEAERVRGFDSSEKLQTAMQTACVQRALYTLFAGETDYSRKVFARRLQYVKAVPSATLRQQALSYKAHLARVEKRYEDAIRLFTELIESHKQVDGPRHINVYIAEVERAKVYKESGRLEEAIALYEANIACVEKDYPNYQALHTMHCQLAGAYLDARMPEKARLLLQNDVAGFKDLQGAVHAEQCYLLSKAYQQKNDTEQELFWLKKAAPLMEASYGRDFPKRKYVRERLAALSPE